MLSDFKRMHRVTRYLFSNQASTLSRYDECDLLLGHGLDNLVSMRILFVLSLMGLTGLWLNCVYAPDVYSSLSFGLVFVALSWYVKHLPVSGITDTLNTLEHPEAYRSYLGGRILFTPHGLKLSLRRCVVRYASEQTEKQDASTKTAASAWTNQTASYLSKATSSVPGSPAVSSPDAKVAANSSPSAETQDKLATGAATSHIKSNEPAQHSGLSKTDAYSHKADSQGKTQVKAGATAGTASKAGVAASSESNQAIPVSEHDKAADINASSTQMRKWLSQTLQHTQRQLKRWQQQWQSAPEELWVHDSENNSLVPDQLKSCSFGYLKDPDIPSLYNYRLYAGMYLRLDQLNDVKQAMAARLPQRMLKQNDDLFLLGFGFSWFPKHTRRLHEVMEVGVRPAVFGLKGTPDIHAVEDHHAYSPLCFANSLLQGHTLLLGTTGAGKTRCFDLLIFQAIMRGDTVIVLDPKGDRGLQRSILQAMRMAKREPISDLFCLDIGRPSGIDLNTPAGLRFVDACLAKSQEVDAATSTSTATSSPHTNHAMADQLHGGDSLDKLNGVASSGVDLNGRVESICSAASSVGANAGNTGFSSGLGGVGGLAHLGTGLGAQESIVPPWAINPEAPGYYTASPEKMYSPFKDQYVDNTDPDENFFAFMNTGFNPTSAFERSTEIGERVCAMMSSSGSAASFKAYAQMAVSAAAECLMISGQPVTLENLRSIVADHNSFIRTIRLFFNRLVVKLNTSAVTVFFNRIHGVSLSPLQAYCNTVILLLGDYAEGSVSAVKEQQFLNKLVQNGILQADLMQEQLKAAEGEAGLPESPDNEAEEELSGTKKRTSSSSSKKRTSKKGVHPASLTDLNKFYSWLKERNYITKHAGIDKVLAIATLAPDFYRRVTNGVMPFLSALTAGDLSDLLSGEDRQLPNFLQLIKLNKVFYVALQCLKDASTGQALGKLMMSDLAFVAGELNLTESNYPRLSVFIDEASELSNESLVQLLNKGRSTNFSITLATQCVADLARRTGSESAASQIIANCNNLISLRVNDPQTASVIASVLPHTVVGERSSSIMYSENGGSNIDTYTASRSFMQKDAPLFPSSMLTQLPDLEFVARMASGGFYKGVFPILLPSCGGAAARSKESLKSAQAQVQAASTSQAASNVAPASFGSSLATSGSYQTLNADPVYGPSANYLGRDDPEPECEDGCIDLAFNPNSERPVDFDTEFAEVANMVDLGFKVQALNPHHTHKHALFPECRDPRTYRPIMLYGIDPKAPQASHTLQAQQSSQAPQTLERTKVQAHTMVTDVSATMGEQSSKERGAELTTHRAHADLQRLAAHGQNVSIDANSLTPASTILVATTSSLSKDAASSQVSAVRASDWEAPEHSSQAHTSDSSSSSNHFAIPETTTIDGHSLHDSNAYATHLFCLGGMAVAENSDESAAGASKVNHKSTDAADPMANNPYAQALAALASKAHADQARGKTQDSNLGANGEAKEPAADVAASEQSLSTQSIERSEPAAPGQSTQPSQMELQATATNHKAAKQSGHCNQPQLEQTEQSEQPSSIETGAPSFVRRVGTALEKNKWVHFVEQKLAGPWFKNLLGWSLRRLICCTLSEKAVRGYEFLYQIGLCLLIATTCSALYQGWQQWGLWLSSMGMAWSELSAAVFKVPYMFWHMSFVLPEDEAGYGHLLKQAVWVFFSNFELLLALFITGALQGHHFALLSEMRHRSIIGLRQFMHPLSWTWIIWWIAINVVLLSGFVLSVELMRLTIVIAFWSWGFYLTCYLSLHTR